MATGMAIFLLITIGYDLWLRHSRPAEYKEIKKYTRDFYLFKWKSDRPFREMPGGLKKLYLIHLTVRLALTVGIGIWVAQKII